MSANGLETFDRSIHATNLWLKEISKELAVERRVAWRSLGVILRVLRDRLTVARDLLTETGSIFVQISDENLHRVRAVMDEVFPDQSFVVTIPVKKKGNQKSSLLGPELSGRTLGVIGAGDIGRRVIRRGLGFNMQVPAHDPFIPAETIAASGAQPRTPNRLAGH